LHHDKRRSFEKDKRKREILSVVDAFDAIWDKNKQKSNLEIE
jgi:hypothetical protein